ncbi:group II intron reverse transcriptase/maturase [Lactobacillus sp. CC-MHH1034]|uniref:group II intron reverse transcriptase/maturase n=1 Tax=Agrilactobacillus fermenti TaxID=2586909 RepID=UPI001E312908|nr:group II intron reverse transcriptase/maturase [Agrilactobacillus fermenti]MCD2256010.1 group II intron reverse transcriptase/maturase [Agrilactobacillus fermenti]
MRRSQKTEPCSGHRGMVDLEGQEQLGARSVIPGEDKMWNGVSFQDLVLSRDNLNQAYLKVRSNKGAAGIDGLTVDELLPYLKQHRDELIASLRDGSYQPLPVKRVEIPKPDGSKRKLGIPTVVDRLVQQAVAQVMSPRFEKIFSDSSFGFRPNRSAHDAIKRVIALYDQGYHYVIDLDLKAYFDTVNHDLLMKFVGQYIDDPWLLRLIRKFLTSGIMNGGLFEKSTQGTPQGGNISPLLANIYLNELDKLLVARGHQFVRYADDCNIYVKSKRAGYRVLANVTRFLEKDLKLTVNQKKTRVGSPLRLKFLGFTLGVSKGKAYARPHKVAKERIKQALKLITKRNRGVSLDVIFNDIERKMRGWLQYYSIGHMKSFLKALDAWLRTRIRQYIWKSWKKIRTKFRSLRKLGESVSEARIFSNTRKGYWYTAHTGVLKYTLTNERLARRGLINLSTTYQSIQKRLSY